MGLGLDVGLGFTLSWELMVAVDEFEMTQIAGGDSGSIIAVDCMVNLFSFACDLGILDLILGSSYSQFSLLSLLEV